MSTSVAAPRRVAVVLVQLAATALAVAAVLVVVVPRALGWQGVVVLSGSMEPALPVGAVAFVGKTDAAHVEVGDVVTFTRLRDDHRVTHRVVEVVATPNGPRFRTKGDANAGPDTSLVAPEQLVGEVRLTVPRLGGLASTISGHRVWAATAMALAAAVLVASDLRRRRPAGATASPAAPTAGDAATAS